MPPPSLKSKELYELLDSMKKQLECPVCRSMLRDPVETLCGHIFCKDCISGVAKGSNGQCPICRKKVKQREILPTPNELNMDVVKGLLNAFNEDLTQLQQQEHLIFGSQLDVGSSPVRPPPVLSQLGRKRNGLSSALFSSRSHIKRKTANSPSTSALFSSPGNLFNSSSLTVAQLSPSTSKDPSSSVASHDSDASTTSKELGVDSGASKLLDVYEFHGSQSQSPAKLGRNPIEKRSETTKVSVSSNHSSENRVEEKPGTSSGKRSLQKSSEKPKSVEIATRGNQGKPEKALVSSGTNLEKPETSEAALLEQEKLEKLEAKSRKRKRKSSKTPAIGSRRSKRRRVMPTEEPEVENGSNFVDNAVTDDTAMVEPRTDNDELLSPQEKKLARDLAAAKDFQLIVEEEERRMEASSQRGVENDKEQGGTSAQSSGESEETDKGDKSENLINASSGDIDFDESENLIGAANSAMDLEKSVNPIDASNSAMDMTDTADDAFPVYRKESEISVLSKDSSIGRTLTSSDYSIDSHPTWITERSHKPSAGTCPLDPLAAKLSFASNRGSSINNGESAITLRKIISEEIESGVDVLDSLKQHLSWLPVFIERLNRESVSEFLAWIRLNNLKDPGPYPVSTTTQNPKERAGDTIEATQSFCLNRSGNSGNTPNTSHLDNSGSIVKVNIGTEDDDDEEYLNNGRSSVTHSTDRERGVVVELQSPKQQFGEMGRENANVEDGRCSAPIPFEDDEDEIEQPTLDRQTTEQIMMAAADFVERTTPTKNKSKPELDQSGVGETSDSNQRRETPLKNVGEHTVPEEAHTMSQKSEEAMMQAAIQLEDELEKKKEALEAKLNTSVVNTSSEDLFSGMSSEAISALNRESNRLLPSEVNEILDSHMPESLMSDANAGDILAPETQNIFDEPISVEHSEPAYSGPTEVPDSLETERPDLEAPGIISKTISNKRTASQLEEDRLMIEIAKQEEEKLREGKERSDNQDKAESSGSVFPSGSGKLVSEHTSKRSDADRSMEEEEFIEEVFGKSASRNKILPYDINETNFRSEKLKLTETPKVLPNNVGLDNRQRRIPSQDEDAMLEKLAQNMEKEKKRRSNETERCSVDNSGASTENGLIVNKKIDISGVSLSSTNNNVPDSGRRRHKTETSNDPSENCDVMEFGDLGAEAESEVLNVVAEKVEELSAARDAICRSTEMRFCCTGFTKESIGEMDKSNAWTDFAQLTKGGKKVKSVEECTHLVVYSGAVKRWEATEYLADRTMKYFKAIALKRFLVSHEWVLESLKQKKVLNEEYFEIAGDVVSNVQRGPMKSRTRKDLLLAGHCFFLAGQFHKCSLEDLSFLIKTCGGDLVESLDALLNKRKTIHKSNKCIVLVENGDSEAWKGIWDSNNCVILAIDFLMDCLSFQKVMGYSEYKVPKNKAEFHRKRGEDRMLQN